MATTPPMAGPGPEVGAAGGGVLGEPVGRRRSRLRTYLFLEAGAVGLGYLVAVLRDGAPGSGGAWALAVAGAMAVAVPLWVKSRRELRQEADTRSAEVLAIEADAKLRLVVGDGVGTANLAGRTLADLIAGTATDLTRLPWVQHRSRPWEPEPLRWLGVNAIRVLAGSADAAERRSGRPARLRERVLDRFLGD